MLPPNSKGSHNDSDRSTSHTPKYACFDSTRVLICGYSQHVAQELRKLIEERAGRVVPKAHERQLPHVIICDNTTDKCFKEARKLAGLTVPAVSKEWVEACIKRGTQVAFDPYKVRALTGLTVSSTNFNVTERLELQRKLEEAGATYTAELYRGRCSHLICKTAQGPKYKAAKEWGNCSLVRDAWVTDSISLGYPAPEENYRPPAPGLPEEATAAAAPAAPRAAVHPHVIGDSFTYGRPQQQQQQQQVTVPPAVATPAVPAPDPAAAPARVTRSSSRSRASGSNGSAGDAAAAAQCKQSNQQQDGGNVPQEQQRGTAAGGQHQAAAAPGVPAEPGVAAAVGGNVHMSGDGAPMFLERVVLWWCGIAAGSQEHRELQQILHLYAGVRYPELCDSTTHIMIGSQASNSELMAVKQYLQGCKRRLDVVSPKWLQLCHEEQQLVPADARCRMNLNSLLQHVAVGSAAAGAAAGAAGAAGFAGLPVAGSGPLAGAAGDSNAGLPGFYGATGGSAAAGAAAAAHCGILGGVFAKSASRQGFPAVGAGAGGGEEQQQGEWVPEYWKEQPQGDKVFEGCYFTLVALQNAQSAADHETALKYIRRYGGQVFTASSVKPPPSCPKVFAVCPPSLPPAAEAALMQSDSSFRVVHSSCRVTLTWMDLCIKDRQLVRITARGPLLAPLRHALPLPGFKGVRVFVSGYKPFQRATIHRMVELLGGTVCSTMVKTAPPTHLVIPRWGPDSLPGDAPAAAAAAAGGGSSRAAGADGDTQASEAGGDLPDASVKKIQFAQKYNLQMVLSEWLLECAVDGKKLSEGCFRPAGDLELLALMVSTQQTQGGMASQLQQTQATGGNTQVPPASRQGSFQAAAGSKCPLPSQPHRPAAGAAAAGAAAAAAGAPSSSAAAVDAGASGASRTNWFTASKTQQAQQCQQQHELDQQQQQKQQQQEQPLKRSLAKLLQSSPVKSDKPAAGAAWGSAAGNGGRADAAAQQQQDIQQPQEQQHQELDQQRQQDQQQATTAAAAAASGAAGSALADVGNKLQPTSPPQSKPTEVAGAAAASAANVSTSGALVAGGEAAGEAATEAAAAAAPKVGSSPLLGGSDGDDEHLLACMDDVLKSIHSRDLAGSIDASQQLPMPDVQLTVVMSASRAGSGGPPSAGPSTAGNNSSSGHNLRNKRRAGASGGGKGSGNGGLGGSDPDGSGGVGGLGGSDPNGAGGSGPQGSGGPAASAKRPRRSAAGAAGSGGAAGAMLPPARVPAGGKGAAGSGSGGAGSGSGAGAAAGVRGGNRYGTRRSTAASLATDVMEMSQQVGYDVGEHPELLLAAAGRRRGATAAADEAAKGEMLARLRSLKKSAG